MILRFAPAVLVQPAIVLDDGTDLIPGPPMEQRMVPLSMLKGSALYEELMMSLPALQAQHDASAPSPGVEEVKPNRAVRRAKTNGKVAAK